MSHTSREIKNSVGLFLNSFPPSPCPVLALSWASHRTTYSRQSQLLVDSDSVPLLCMYYSTYTHVLHALLPFPFLLSRSPNPLCLVMMYVRYPLSLASRCAFVSSHGCLVFEPVPCLSLSTPSALKSPRDATTTEKINPKAPYDTNV